MKLQKTFDILSLHVCRTRKYDLWTNFKPQAEHVTPMEKNYVAVSAKQTWTSLILSISFHDFPLRNNSSFRLNLLFSTLASRACYARIKDLLRHSLSSRYSFILLASSHDIFCFNTYACQSHKLEILDFLFFIISHTLQNTRQAIC